MNGLVLISLSVLVAVCSAQTDQFCGPNCPLMCNAMVEPAKQLVPGGNYGIVCDAVCKGACSCMQGCNSDNACLANCVTGGKLKGIQANFQNTYQTLVPLLQPYLAKLSQL